MKNTARMEKIPAPISLSKRSAQPVDSATPYRMEWGTPLQSVDSNSNGKVHKSSISNMKEELSNIKTDVQKLLNEECPQAKRTAPGELLGRSVRAELDYHKEVEEKLRIQIRELKLRLSEEKLVRQEKEMYQRRMEQLRSQWKVERNRLKKVNEEAAQKYAHDAAKWQSDYDQLIVQLNQAKSQVSDLQQQLQDEKNQLVKTVGDLQRQIAKRDEEYESKLKFRQGKYENALEEFKKLEIRFDKNVQENVLTLKHQNIALEQQISNITFMLQEMKKKCHDTTLKLERTLRDKQDMKDRYMKLEDRIRMVTKPDNSSEVLNLQAKIQNMETDRAQLYAAFLQKSRQLDELTDAYQQNIEHPTAELHRLRIENAELSKMYEIVNEQLVLARGRIQYLDQIMIEKDSYIEAMEDMQPSNSTTEAIRQLEEKCRDLLQERSELVRNYENAIRVLENSMNQSRERSLSQSMILGQSMISYRNSTFDEALKEQLKEIEQLRTLNKQKSEELFELKGELAELQRNLQSYQAEKDIERLRIQAEEKTLKNTYEITVQDLKNQIQSQKRKMDALQRKIDRLNDEVKRKDDFIKSSIIGRIGKQQSESDVQYLTRELQNFVKLSVMEQGRVY